MKRTRFITFPRSGHHWLADMLRKRLPDFRHADVHKGEGSLDTHPGINAEKHHDFQLDLHKDPAVTHIIQVRNWENSKRSWIKFHDCTEETLLEQDYCPPDYRCRWLEKWVVDPVPNRLIVRYEDMLKDTELWVAKVIVHITEEGDPGAQAAHGFLEQRQASPCPLAL